MRTVIFSSTLTSLLLHLLTRRHFPTFGAYITGEYGHYDAKRQTGALNFPQLPRHLQL